MFVYFVDHFFDRVKQVSKSLAGMKIDFEKNAIPSFPKSRYTGSDIRVRDDSMNCAHVAFAIEGPGYNDPDFVAMEIAANVNDSKVLVF